MSAAASLWRPDAAGWLPAARQLPSPNCDDYPAGTPLELAVVHAISLPPDEFGGPGIAALFTNTLDPDAHPYYQGIKDLHVSSHFVIRRDGELLQFVPLTRRAWHAGLSCWQGRSRCNDFSVGIELEGCDTQPFEDVQYRVLGQLLRALAEALPLRAVTGHQHVAPGRKTDPGPFFAWPRLQAELAGSGLEVQAPSGLAPLA